MNYIYKITNMFNKDKYIGVTNNIEKRFKHHLFCAYNKNSIRYNLPLYIDIRKFGLQNFQFEIIDVCNDCDRSTKERYYIDKYNAVYNINIKEDHHHNKKLTKSDVIDIRIRYNNHERKQSVYLDYKDRINKTGFHKIWNGYTWKNVYAHVYTLENKTFHKNNTSNFGDKNGRSKLTNSLVKDIRKAKTTGKMPNDVYNQLNIDITYKSFLNIWYGCNWKNI